MYNGLLNLSWGGYIIALLIFTHITILGVTIFLHRAQAHRALEVHPALAHVFRLWLWLSTGMVTKAWTSIHRKHHAKCETVEDPHSPQILGIRCLLLEGAELYRKEAKNQETLDRYGHGTPDDWLERHVYSKHSDKGILVMMIIDLLLFGLPGLTIWALQMAWIPFFAAGIVNGIGHYWGYRNFEYPDASRNISPLGIFIGGEELHNNHHTFPTSAKLSAKWWELDMGWMYIRLFSWLKLVKIKRILQRPLVQAEKTTIDIETVKALLTHRFQIMAHYSRNVILPVLQEEKQRAGEAGKRLFKDMKKLMIREESLISSNKKQQLINALEQIENLKKVYQFRKKLQSIWQRTAASSSKELLDALQEWCKQAESSSIDALRSFAMQLKNYATN